MVYGDGDGDGTCPTLSNKRHSTAGMKISGTVEEEEPWPWQQRKRGAKASRPCSPPSSRTRALPLTSPRLKSRDDELIGWTPLVEMKNIAKKDDVEARLVGKMEAYQPLCSVKDRSALRMIEDAEGRGLISPGVTTLIEPTSGNHGIGLVFVAVQRGYRFIAVMPAKYSLDKQMLLRFLGAELILTDPAVGFKGMNDKVEELLKSTPNSHCLDQVTNPANPEAHFKWTGPEIWKDTAGKVDMFVASVGSGGRHKIQGTGAGFIPEVLDTSVIDEVVTVSTEEAMAMARKLAKEGLLVALSSGANVAACLKIAGRDKNRGKMIVTMFPSGGERYMYSDLFADVRDECVAMTF